MHLTRPVGEDERAEEHGDPDDDEHVGEVERRPGVEVEEVRHAPEAHAVDEVRDAAAEDETQVPPAARDVAGPERAKNQTISATATAVIAITKLVRLAKSPNAMPEFST